ncbi:Hypothetical predicted protein [Mytilus galloprovincialis]|uniref:Triple QxxK/R motif-containing protein n=1 Tax=Mytilus galloprovincialis TaxID=29158 RepID=A0A8B6G9N3_MYTGA|nr:Hypothetical predicted protein [Mytilus galloprovincialis]
MGKKDAAGVRAGPVDQYRKQIGKQDYKKSKKELKSQKQRAEKKNSAIGVKEVILVLLAFLAVMVAVYAFLFWQLSGKDEQ